MHSIAIWHGKRIEAHFADWVGRIPGWVSQKGVIVNISGNRREIDNLVSSPSLGLVLAIETKRILANQDGLSLDKIKTTAVDYKKEKNSIIGECKLSAADFRYFVVDAYGNSIMRARGLPPIIRGDEIARIFGSCIWAYKEWERSVIREETLKRFEIATENLVLDVSTQDVVDDDSINVDECSSTKKEILSFIDEH
jgi:hypothetical protein